MKKQRPGSGSLRNRLIDSSEFVNDHIYTCHSLEDWNQRNYFTHMDFPFCLSY